MKFRNDSELPESGGSKNFLKLKDKESVQGVFRGDMHEFFILWEANKSKEVPEGTPDSKFRFRVNFVLKEGTSFVSKIFEQGAMVYRTLRDLSEEYDLETTIVKITRNGTGTDTTYSILPLLKKPLTPAELDYFANMDLLPLVKTTHAQAVNEEVLPF